MSSKYRDEEGIRAAFERIISLPPEKSDNTGRVNRILRFADSHFPAKGGPDTPRSILDVGSGLCVFLYLMKKAGWDGTALDPDPRSVSHAREAVGVKAICGDFPRLEDDIGGFDVITFNKVLEHVEDPVSMLAASGNYLNKGGVVYVEVPDGECAISDGPGRQEFFIDHFHVFSMASLAFLAGKAGFTVVEMERLREPSAKFTLRAFLTRSK
ncbi:MAG: class I SAM-dependent methyltransferase [bacterium]